MPWVDSLDWTTLNSLRRYPLREGASAKSIDELFSIPDTFIVDFTLCASSDVSRRFYISSFTNSLNSVVIEISDQYNTVLGLFEIIEQQHTQDKDYYLTPTTAYIGASGKLTIGSFKDISGQPAGKFKFSIAATEFEPRTIIPGLRGVDRIQFTDNANNSYTLTGDITLSARYNIDFVYSGTDRIFLDAGDGLGLNLPCEKEPAIKTINGVRPDDNGNISLLGTSCLSISNTAQYTLELSDNCCTPCSGCNDLETLTTRLTSLENRFLDLKGGYNEINSRLATYLSTINSSCAST